MRVIICGAREWADRDKVAEFLLRRADRIEIVIRGDRRGADEIGGEIAAALGLRVRSFPTDWESYGEAAGAARNKQMLEYLAGDADIDDCLVAAFHPNLERSRETRDMVSKARLAGVPVLVVV